MDTQARVILTALDPDLVTPSQRVITLTPEASYFPIGRASKSLSKGLQGAVSNAWFDSPVMSRDHAEISMSFEDNSITIQDIGSMHGTHVNDTTLDTKCPTPLKIGDIVVFGAEVKRGAETFPACSFRISYEVLPYRAANTFAFPESSEIDEEEDYELSDDDIVGRHEIISSDDGTSIISSSGKLAQPVASVDLTRDESPVGQSQTIVDLTGETTAERRIFGLMAGRPTDIDNNSDPTSIGLYAGRPPIVIESEDDDGDFSTDSESDSDPEVMEAATSYGIDLDSLDDTDADDDEEDAESMFEPSQVQRPDGLVQYVVDTNDNSKLLLFDENADLETSDGESDDQSDLGLSEAGAEGMKALFDNNLLSSDNSVPAGFDNSHNEEIEEPSVRPTPNHISFETLMDPDLVHSPNITTMNATAQHFLGSTLSRPSQIMRQPSPSDAAMVKTATPSQQCTAPVSVCMIGEVGSSSAQKLGEKSGKIAYFRAREVNKANFQRMEEDTEAGEFSQSISAGASSCFPTAPTVCMMEEQQNNDGFSSKTVTSGKAANTTDDFSKISGSPSMGTSPTALGMPTREQCAFLDNPDQNLFPIREASPLPDMTSAVVYNNSKETMAAAAAASTRSGIKIKDIIDSTSSQHITNSNKRKADDISEASPEEIKIWAKATSTHVPPLSSSHSIPSKPEAEVPALPKQHSIPILAQSEVRPTKKQRILESVGYIALGGVTAVAGLFAALVATAPEF